MWVFKQNIYKTRRVETAPTFRMWNFSSPGRETPEMACLETVFPLELYTHPSVISLDLGTLMYVDSNLSIPIGTDGLWYQEGVNGISYRFGNGNQITEITNCSTPPPAPLPEDYTYYQAIATNCTNEVCSGGAENVWIYNLSPTLVDTKYYYNSVDNKSYQIISPPYTYAEYVTAGSPPAIETGVSFSNDMYNSCTCLPVAPV